MCNKVNCVKYYGTDGVFLDKKKVLSAISFAIKKSTIPFSFYI